MDRESQAVGLSAQPDDQLRQKALLDELFATVPEAIVLLDTDDRILRVNPEFTRIFGYAEEEALGRPINELVVPEELWAEAEECSRRGIRGEILNVETMRRRKDGTRVPVSIVGVPVLIAGSQISEYVIYRDITEPKRAEQRLRQSEAYLAEAQKLSQTGSWAWNPASDNTYYSEECYRLLGFEPHGPPPPLETVIQRIHPDDQADCRERVEKGVRAKVDFELDYRIILPDKKVRDIRCVCHPVLDRSGSLIELIGTVIDITERKRAEQTLGESEAYLAEAQRLSQTGSWASKPFGESRYWSEECYRVLGFDPAGPPPLFEEFFHRIHPDDQAASRERWERAIRDKADFEFGYRIVHPNKGIRDIHVLGHAVLNQSGDLDEFVGTVIDITERKRAEQELQQLVDFVPQLIVVHDSDGKVIHANRVAREYTGLTLEEFRSLDVIGRVIHPDDVERVRAARKHGFAGSEPFEVDARLLGKDGSHRWFLGRFNPFVEEGRVRRWYVSATEIESLKQEEERVRKENVRLEERTRIAQELHDTLLQTFQSALLHLGAAVDGITQDSPFKPELDRTLQIMRQGIEEGRNAIQGLRSSGSQPSDLVVALSRIQEELEERPNIDFRVIVTGCQRQLPQEIQDEIYRIGREAVGNAFCHSGAKRVELELEYSDTELRMRIRDNGCGIDPQVLEKGRDGHWGLAGMRERATRIGGLVKILSSPMAGTEVQLSIPSNVAFHPANF